jgi:hypothetical protein
MKVLCLSRIVFSFCLLLIIGGVSFAQEQPKDQLFYIHEEVAKIDKIDQYNESGKEFTRMMKDAKLDVPSILASQTDDLHFYYLVPLKNYADIDKLTAAFNDMMTKTDKDMMAKNMKEGAEATEYTRELVFRRSDELSYNPENAPKLDMSKENFIHWDFYTYKPEDRQQVMDLGAKFKKLNEEKKVETPYTVWLADLGEHNNLIVVTTIAKDAVSFYQQMDKDNATLGKEGDDLWNKMITMLEHFDHKNGHTRPDLSYMKGK